MPKVCWVNKALLLLATVLLATACKPKTAQNEAKLPVLGPMELVSQADGSVDTIFFPYPNFQLEDQYGLTVTPDSLKNQVLVVDFFFSTCPTICKDLLRNMRKVHAKWAADGRVRLLSHSVDPAYDTREVLAAYAASAGATGRNWLFLRGEEAVIYDLAQKAYLSQAQADSNAPGGFLHSGHIILLDAHKRIRGVYDGTDDSQLPALLAGIESLLAESH